MTFQIHSNIPAIQHQFSELLQKAADIKPVMADIASISASRSIFRCSGVLAGLAALRRTSISGGVGNKSRPYSGLPK